jgi:tetratricopeptide (TPR) repeat protein
MYNQLVTPAWVVMVSGQIDPWRALLREAENQARAGKHEQAERLYKQAVVEAEAEGDPKDGSTLSALMHLGDFYKGEKNYPQAEMAYQRALPIFERLLGSKNGLTALCLRSLCEVYREQSKHDKAKEITQRIEEIGFVD